MPGENKGKKVFDIKAGNVSAAIWENTRYKKQGGSFQAKNVTLSKSFIKQGASQRGYSNISLDLNEIRKAIIVLQKCEEKMLMGLEDTIPEKVDERESGIKKIMDHYGGNCSREMAEKLYNEGTRH